MGVRIMVSPNRVQGSHFLPLASQGHLYNLTFDEVQTQLGNVGKPLNCMNLDELMKNVISAEGCHDQLMQNPSPSSSSFAPSSLFVGNANINGASKKTGDEVWKEIVLHEPEHVNGANPSTQSVQQQLGETMLEDFLIPAGSINVGNPQPLLEMDPMVVMSQQETWLQMQMAAIEQQQQHQQNQQQMATLHSNYHVSDAVFENPVMDANFPENQLALSAMPAVAAAASSDSQSVAGEKKSQFSDVVMEKSMERRKKRMIKNRESAARSRARKQAYTNQLEHEVLELRKTNSWLKKLKEVERVLTSNPAPLPRYQLRRIGSAQF